MHLTRHHINIDEGILSSVVLPGAIRTSNGADEDLSDSIALTGIVRDFKERTKPGGHPDFEQTPDHAFGVYAGNVALSLETNIALAPVHDAPLPMVTMAFD